MTPTPTLPLSGGGSTAERGREPCYRPSHIARSRSHPMTPHRRTFLQLAACALASPAALRTASAQHYPARPVRVVVPVAAGGANDVTARLIGQWLSERLGQQFVIENRPGAGTNVGTEAVIRSRRRRLHAAHRRQQCGDQRHLVRAAQLHFSPRHRADRQHRARAAAHAGHAVASGAQRSRVHRLCQGQSRQDRDGLGRQRFAGARHRGIFQADDRHRPHACALSRRGARRDRSARRADPGGVHRDGDVARAMSGPAICAPSR